ncbi:hypothetical protein M422DRAFT_180355 [Sphaerobolus stellatus SS14]|uniref:LIM zinc-binding domain-containing protein n=1 Tax=Sphaerobolus stellatus (strain SS14) TaxID=990650 RepID=A0A0C9VEA4_SPHS4|nr:hypothetical protein M422DRAFT_180355 [Sphaerobolus stellatus SS14]
MPRRSHTNPTVSVSPRDNGAAAIRSVSDAKATRRKHDDTHGKSSTAVCVRCELTIDKWIKLDPGPGVLCERCWKNMYLPKCRRCNKPIEKAAVYASDGQLKGKYHPECFNCAVCNRPFPDKSFYVYDGQPLCSFHYAEANRSLCSREQCGKPIEGPCAIAWNGEKYHPGCMSCQWNGEYGDEHCTVVLGEEYWEVDGTMLCDRHGARYEMQLSGSGSSNGGSEYGGKGRRSGETRRSHESERRSGGSKGSQERMRDEKGAKARKRVTRLINLTSGGLGF